MIARTPIVNTRSNLRLNQDSLDRVYGDHQTDTFKVYIAIMYQMFSNMDTFVYVKQRRGMQDGQAVLFDVQKHCLDPDHVARQATDAEGKLQNSNCDGERKKLDWDKYVALHKEEHAIMESLTDYGYSGMDSGTKVRHFFKGIKSYELEAIVNVVCAHQNSMTQILMQLCLIWAKLS